jgi:nitroreductase
MADNYLEKRYEELFNGAGASKKRSPRKGNPSLDSLLLKNRSYRGYDESYVVTEEELREMVKVVTKVPSAKNQQVLRFKLVTRATGGEIVLKHTKYGGALPELHLPFEGTAPYAFIIVCTTVPEGKWVDIDLGIAAQSILLKCVEMGLNGICIGAFNKQELISAFNLKYEPVMVLAIGKGAEKIQLLSIREDEGHSYFRDKGIHYVPKVQLDDLLM